jgi:hypothetical protein
MAIPESQLDTWSHQGATTTSRLTHISIRAALAADGSRVQDKVASGDVEIYLQGSYKNDTNIRGDSDVDVVVQLNETFYRDLSALPENQKRLYEATYAPATYHWAEFRRDVLQSLRSYYGAAAVTEGNKSLKLEAQSGRLAADIVPVTHFRKYEYFYSQRNQGYVDGIKFFDRRDNTSVINFPKPHYDNGVRKQSANSTNGWYKPTVRVFKNARTYMVEQGLLGDEVAPSYFLECLLYNVPDSRFGGTLQSTVIDIFNWLWGTARANALVCQNEQLKLFGNSPEQWSLPSAKTFLAAFRDLWEGW